MKTKESVDVKKNTCRISLIILKIKEEFFINPSLYLEGIVDLEHSVVRIVFLNTISMLKESWGTYITLSSSMDVLTL